jgi:acyl CoA:acetate/3-ketoacid CoA transferase beta subunit
MRCSCEARSGGCVMVCAVTRVSPANTSPQCSYPLTGLCCVSRVYTDHEVFEIDPSRGAVTGPRDVRDHGR